MVIDLPNYFTDWAIDLSIRPFTPENSNLSQLDETVIRLISNQIKEDFMGLFVEQLSILLASTTATTTTVTVTTTIASVVPANSNRKGLSIKNNAARGAAISFSSTMDVPNGNFFMLIPGNATYDLPVNYIGEIYAVVATLSGTASF
ncbi:MAG: hypothetical protein HC930_15605 [Hydrococcus sp. SU_1_0]|nr:hypothetical protein [Hydrococcus sp. SU_1_0]